MNLNKLNTLTITSNQLTSIPIEIKNLTHLIQFDLSENQLKKFPQEICIEINTL